MMNLIEVQVEEGEEIKGIDGGKEYTRKKGSS